MCGLRRRGFFHERTRRLLISALRVYNGVDHIHSQQENRPVNFIQATDALTGCPTHPDIAKEAGVSVQTIRQARLAPDHPNNRPPPAGWEQAIANLARERAAELVELAETLEAGDDSRL